MKTLTLISAALLNFGILGQAHSDEWSGCKSEHEGKAVALNLNINNHSELSQTVMLANEEVITMRANELSAGEYKCSQMADTITFGGLELQGVHSLDFDGSNIFYISYIDKINDYDATPRQQCKDAIETADNGSYQVYYDDEYDTHGRCAYIFPGQ